MSAAEIAIDTLPFRDLLRIGLEDLPGASRGEWTLHGPVDPGVSLLELFAWQLEQRLYMGEQLTEPIVRAALRLLGVPDAAPALAAATVLSVTGPAGRVPAGTVFVLDGDDARRFALDDDVWAAPVSAVRTSGRLLSDGDALELVFEGAGGPAASGTQLSLLVEVEAAPHVAPAWLAGAVDVDAPARLAWTAIGPDGSSAPVQVTDSTGAFRRSGLLRLPWPAVFDRAGGEPRRLRATALSTSYTEPVRILDVHPNAVVARHRVPAQAELELEGLQPLPGRRLTLPGTAGLLCGDGEGDVVLSVVERDGIRHDWRGVPTWVGAGPADRVFLVDRERGELRFGDGRSGRILRPGAEAGSVRFALGAGAAGNIGVDRAWAQEGGPAKAVNRVAADGGAEPETLEAARERAADALATPDRSVTVDDARELAVATEGLGLRRAHVSPGFHPGFPCAPVPGALAVTIVPHADRDGETDAWTPAPQPDAGAIAAVRKRLERARLLGQEVFVLAPRYRRVRVAVTVSAIAGESGVRRRIADAVRRHLDPLVGGSERDGWPFGAPVRPSALAGVISDVLGPEATVTQLSAALDDGPFSDCAELEIGPRELVHLDAVTVAWTAGAPTGGGLR